MKTSKTGSARMLDERDALRAGQAVVGQRVPDYTLIDRQGRSVRLSSYRGKPLLVRFIYTACFPVCPLSTRAQHEAVKGPGRLLAPNQFNVVSIGFNQPVDTTSGDAGVRGPAPHRPCELGVPQLATSHRRCADARLRLQRCGHARWL